MQIFAPANAMPRDDIFKKQTVDLPFSFMGVSQINISNAQLCYLLCGALASLVTPFGGFFASGLKRASLIKDFSNALPGHGGFVDRFDCIIVMSIIVYAILASWLYKGHFLVSDTLAKLQLSLSEL